MKVRTINYEKRYRKSLERARAIYQGKYKPEIAAILAEALQSIFPELAESEDEKIRKDLIHWVKTNISYERIPVGMNFSNERVLAWLEKQGEKQDYNPYKATVESIASMCDRYSTSDDLKDFYNNIKVKCKDAVEYDNTWIKKQGEQRPEADKAKDVENDICRECDNGNWLANLCWKGHSRCDGQKCIDFEKDEEL